MGTTTAVMLAPLKELLLIFTSVLFIVDPFAAVPAFLAMTARDTPETRRLMARRGAYFRLYSSELSPASP